MPGANAKPNRVKKDSSKVYVKMADLKDKKPEEKIKFETMKFDGDRPVERQGAGAFDIALGEVRSKLSERFSATQLQSGGDKVREQARQIATEVHKNYLGRAVKENMPRLNFTRDDFVAQAISYTFGLGPIDHLLEDETIEDIAINGPSEVMIYRDQWERTDITFPNKSSLLNVLNTALSKAERTVNRIKPIVDAAIDYNRYSVVVQPIANPDPTAVIRIPRHAGIDLDDLVKPWHVDKKIKEEQKEKVHTNIIKGDIEDSPMPDYPDLELSNILNRELASYLHSAVLAGLSIAVIGPTGVGKTALITALGRCLPVDYRVLIIEDTPEIRLYPNSKFPNNVLTLQTRPPSLEDVPEITQADLVKLALRQRPDALTLSEARGKEIFDLLNALYTGHSNGLTTFHAYGLHEMYSRLSMMISQSERGRHLRMHHVAQIISTALDVVVVLEKEGDTRRVRAVGEMDGSVKNVGGDPEPEIDLIFEYSGGRSPKLNGPLKDSLHSKRFENAGVPEQIYKAG
jgi:pilus assembly protein CpaF